MRERERIHHRRRSKPLCHRRRSPNHHAIAADLQSLLLILISNPRQSERPTTKIQSKPKPTSNLRERIKVRERENPPSPPLQTTTPLLSISNRRAPARWWLTPTCSPQGSLSLGKPLSSFFLVKLFLLQHNTDIYNKENLI